MPSVGIHFPYAKKNPCISTEKIINRRQHLAQKSEGVMTRDPGWSMHSVKLGTKSKACWHKDKCSVQTSGAINILIWKFGSNASVQTGTNICMWSMQHIVFQIFFFQIYLTAIKTINTWNWIFIQLFLCISLNRSTCEKDIIVCGKCLCCCEQAFYSSA